MSDRKEEEDGKSVVSVDVDPSCGIGACPASAFYCLGCGLLILGSLLFFIFCTESVPGYTFSDGFNKDTCTVIASALLDEDVCCESEAKSESKCTKGYTYPCVTVIVTNGNKNMTFYDDFRSLRYESKTAKQLGCSYFHCGSDSYKTHKKRAKSFQKKYSTGDDVTCYVKGKDALAETPSSGSFGAMLAFSLIFIISGAIVCLITFIVMRIKTKEHHAKLGDEKTLLKSDTSSASNSEISSSAGQKSSQSRESAMKRESTAFVTPRPTTRSGVKINIPEEKGAGKK